MIGEKFSIRMREIAFIKRGKTFEILLLVN